MDGISYESQPVDGPKSNSATKGTELLLPPGSFSMTWPVNLLRSAPCARFEMEPG